MKDITINHSSYKVNSQTTSESPQQPEHKLPNNQIAPSPCSCECSEITAVVSSTIHWAAWLCLGCGKHRGWIEHPETANRREAQDQLIDRLLGVATGWNRMFLEELRERRKRSPRQLEILTKIANRYLGGAS